jgi:hypothetical protein
LFRFVLQRHRNTNSFSMMLNEKHILGLQKKLTADYKADRDAIRRVLKLLKKQTAKAASKQRPEDKNGVLHLNGSTGESGTEKRIAAAIQAQTGTFTLGHLLAVLPEENRNTISGVLFRSKDKTIRVVTPGRGRRAAVYEKM